MPVGLDTHSDSRIPSQCSATSPGKARGRNGQGGEVGGGRSLRGREARDNCPPPVIFPGAPLGLGSAGTQGRRPEAKSRGRSFNQGLGRVSLGGRYRPLLSSLIWGSWLLHHVPNHPWSRGPLPLPPQTDRYWVSVVWGGGEELSA